MKEYYKNRDMKEYTVRVYQNGNKYWYLNGKLHREDGPAIVCTNGLKEWYINGKELTEEEFKLRTSEVKEMTMEELVKELGYNVKIKK